MYKIKFELFKISDEMYRAQVEDGSTPQFDKIGEKEMTYDRDMPLGELLINNYSGRNTISDVDQFLTEFKVGNFVSCSRDCYLVTNKYNGSNEKIERRDEDTAWKTPVLLPITNLSGNSNSASIVSYRSTISQAKPYSNWVNNDSQNDENDNIFYHNWSNGENGFIWIKIYLICGETRSPPQRRYFGNMNDLDEFENDWNEESGIIIGEPEPEPEPEFSFPGHKYLNLRYKEEFPRVKDQYKDLVLRLHPDKGGDGTEFIQLRKEYAAIKKALGLTGGKKSNKNSNTKKLHNIKRKRISKRKRIRKRKSKKNKTKHYKNNSYFVRS